MGTLLKGAAQRANDNYGEAVPFVATVMEDLDLLRNICGDTVVEYTKECHVYSTLYPLLIVYNRCNYVELCIVMLL